ncbi:AIG1 family protein putative [Entamoeba histolytica]|uniref:AIG1 family protein, putative n=2 Tax=Entamoeba histolytica TaxID=5759 RepID=C4MB37_ENTH1|nr:AIG1 family protein, putative [Entamoeba histolytica HM-1:IMSS]EAL42945.2 AIG1 family protein, putative [Entamoeba histolytica HM-1:IMSS]GAT99110.1 AIG1 family protein putative [Entamoeba histolytica]|eukprot:XP_648331.2 AIG1 family protein, putative [Entamoeba histolytica HM-1:IMSS]
MSVPEDNTKQTKLLLIGETGNGKSSLGNFILQKYVFKVGDSPNPETREVVGENGKGERNDLIVIDTPSLQESKEFNEKFLNDIVDSQPDERCDNRISENEIERLIEWGRGITPINIDTNKQEKTPVIEEKEEIESMGNNDKQIITQVKRKRREIRIEFNGEIK